MTYPLLYLPKKGVVSSSPIARCLLPPPSCLPSLSTLYLLTYIHIGQCIYIVQGNVMVYCATKSRARDDVKAQGGVYSVEGGNKQSFFDLDARLRSSDLICLFDSIFWFVNNFSDMNKFIQYHIQYLKKIVDFDNVNKHYKPPFFASFFCPINSRFRQRSVKVSFFFLAQKLGNYHLIKKIRYDHSMVLSAGRGVVGTFLDIFFCKSQHLTLTDQPLRCDFVGHKNLQLGQQKH